MTIFIDKAEQWAGLERPTDGLSQKKCPKCGARTSMGYGMMGGGLGTYVMCLGDDNCGWFYKEVKPDDESR